MLSEAVNYRQPRKYVSSSAAAELSRSQQWNRPGVESNATAHLPPHAQGLCSLRERFLAQMVVHTNNLSRCVRHDFLKRRQHAAMQTTASLNKPRNLRTQPKWPDQTQSPAEILLGEDYLVRSQG